MSARAAVLLVTIAGAVGAAWVAIKRERAAGAQVAQDNLPFLYEGGAGGQLADVVGEGGAGGGFEASWESVATAAVDFVDGALMKVGLNVFSGRWLSAAQRPDAAPYYRALTAAESKYGIPSHMLVRLCYQESRYNPIAHNTGSDAQGIMQIVPRWHPNVDPWDAFAAIDYGGKYLLELYRQFGTWEHALQAYNWGPANLKKYLAGQLSRMPSETSNYSRMILADIGAGGVVA